MLVAFVALDAGSRLPDALGVDGWIARLVVVVIFLQVAALAYDVPFDWWVDLVHDRRWGVSTQTPRGFVVDNLKSFLLTTGLGAGVAVALFAVIRATDAWWFWGWLLTSGLVLAFGFLFPIVLAPIFNTFTPLESGELATRIDAIAARAGVRINGTYVVDESRRSNRDNAYVAGLGRTRHVVLFDTLLEHPTATVEQVVAHEIGHWRLHHLRRSLPLTVLALLVVFAGAAAVTGAFDVDVGDPASLPLLLLLAQAGGALLAGRDVVRVHRVRAASRPAGTRAARPARRPHRDASARAREEPRRARAGPAGAAHPQPPARRRADGPRPRLEVTAGSAPPPTAPPPTGVFPCGATQ